MPRAWEANFLRNEFVLATALAVAVAVWDVLLNGRSTLAPLIEGNRAAIYGTAASIAGALLGFLITTVTVIQALVSNRAFARLRASDKYSTLWRVFRWTIRSLAVATALSFVSLIADRDTTPCWPLFHLEVWALLVAAFLVARSIWILERVLAVSVQEN